MSTRRAQRVDALTDDVSTLREKVKALHEDLERTLEEVEEAATEETAQSSADSTVIQTEVDNDRARADGGNVGWSEIETAGPDGSQDAEQAAWTAVETE